MESRLIYDLDKPELTQSLVTWGQPPYRANQIWEGLYKKHWQTPDQFTSLPQQLRDLLAERFRFDTLKPIKTLLSKDKETEKYLFQFPDGQTIESVLMLYNTRQTICISTQVGCTMGCTFCATGQMGFKRNLSSGEIVEQVLFFVRLLAMRNEPLTNIVVMGMGEPFLNYEATLSALTRLNADDGFNFGARRMTISTVGIVPQIKRFTAKDSQINLAISLHAANDELRSSLLPVNRKYPLSELIPACREYVNQTHRKLTFEWALIQGVNDSTAHAQELAHLVKPMLCHVNVIALNPTHKFTGLPSTHENAEAFCAELIRLGIPATIRLRRGIDVHAGCGQLASS